jgi:hypothetical protein
LPWIMLCGVSFCFNVIRDVVLVGMSDKRADYSLSIDGSLWPLPSCQWSSSVAQSRYCASASRCDRHGALPSLSIPLVQAREGRSLSGSPSRLTMSISSSPSRMLAATPGASWSSHGRDCATAARLCRHRRVARLDEVRDAPWHATTWATARPRCGLYESGTAGSVCGRQRRIALLSALAPPTVNSRQTSVRARARSDYRATPAPRRRSRWRLRPARADICGPRH